MKIQSINTYNNYNPSQSFKPYKKDFYSPSFTAASDISLRYVYEKHAKYLPKSILQKIEELLSKGEEENLPQLWQLHNEVYKPLMEAKTLDEAKTIFPEFRDVIDVQTLSGNRSKAIKAILEKMPLDQFTLTYLQKLYAPTTQEIIIKLFGFTNRSLAEWLNKKLNIPKLAGNYLQLLRMSNEEENRRIAECSRQAIYNNPEAQAQRQAKAAEHHRTPEYREKKRTEMIRYYEERPEQRERVRRITERTWQLCPEVKSAFSAYTAQCSDFVKSALAKKKQHKPLNSAERRALGGYYKGFWSMHPDFREVFSSAKKQAEREYREGLI